MPEFEISAPDGSKFKVNAPEGATKEDAIAYVQQNFYQQKAKEVEKRIDPFKQVAQESSGMENFLAGMGGAMKGLYLGGKQMLNLASQAEVDDHNRAMSGLRSTTSGTLGEIAGNVVPAAATAIVPGANTLTGSALTGAVLNSLQPLAEGESRLWEGVKGAGLGAVGQGVANTVGRMVKPVQAAPLTGRDADLITKAKSMGIDLNAAQETGSKALRWVDSALDNLPFTAERQATAKAAQREAWQRAVLKQTGEDASLATDDVLGAAKKRIGQQFNDISSRNNVVLDSQAAKEIAAVAKDNNIAGPLKSGKVDDVAEWLKSLTQGKTVTSPVLGPNGQPITHTLPAQHMTGELYQDVRSILTRNAQSAFSSGDSQLGQSLKGIRDALDGAAERSVAAADSAAWKEARNQYKALKAIQKATDTASGNISPLKLINELGRKNPNGMYFGIGDQTMPDLARVGKTFIGDRLPDSGTAQRNFYMNLLTGGGGALGALGVAGAVPIAPLIGAATAAATPMAMQRAMWSKGIGGRYLKNGLLDPDKVGNVVRPLVTAAPIGLLGEVGK